MRANSDKKPKTFVKTRGRIHFNFNIIESKKKDIDNKELVFFDYDYVIVEDVNRDTLIKAIMRNAYSFEDEIALINNKFRNNIEDSKKYSEYQLFRDEVKKIVDKAI